MRFQQKSDQRQTASPAKSTLPRTWHSPRHIVPSDDLIRVLPVVTACVCLFLIVSAVVVGAYTGKLSPADVETRRGVSATGSMIGLVVVLYHIIRVTLLSLPTSMRHRPKKDKE